MRWLVRGGNTSVFEDGGDSEQMKRFLQSRYVPTLRQYGRSSARNGRAFSLFENCIIVLSALTTFLISTGVPNLETRWKYLPLVISLVVSILAALMKASNYQDKWVKYRGSANRLRRELSLYRACAGDYEAARGDTSRGESLFVRNIEKIIEEAESEWGALHRNEGTQVATATS